MLKKIQSVFLEEDDQGYILRLEFDHADPERLDVRLSPNVAVALLETVRSTLLLQAEVDKLDAIGREAFPLEMARGVLQGQGWFKAVGPGPIVTQDLPATSAEDAQKVN